MKTYLVKVMADRYPTEYRIEASDWSTAAARGLRQWKKKFKRSQAETIKVHITKLGDFSHENVQRVSDNKTL